MSKTLQTENLSNKEEYVPDTIAAKLIAARQQRSGGGDMKGATYAIFTLARASDIAFLIFMNT